MTLQGDGDTLASAQSLISRRLLLARVRAGASQQSGLSLAYVPGASRQPVTAGLAARPGSVQDSGVAEGAAVGQPVSPSDDPRSETIWWIDRAGGRRRRPQRRVVATP